VPSIPASGPGYFDFDDDFRREAHEQDAVVRARPSVPQGWFSMGALQTSSLCAAGTSTF
jgi:hypothetical protein